MGRSEATVDEAWRYGFRWGPMVVERTAHIPGRGYCLTIRTERQSMQVYVSEKGQKLRACEPTSWGQSARS